MLLLLHGGSQAAARPTCGCMLPSLAAAPDANTAPVLAGRRHCFCCSRPHSCQHLMCSPLHRILLQRGSSIDSMHAWPEQRGPSSSLREAYLQASPLGCREAARLLSSPAAGCTSAPPALNAWLHFSSHSSAAEASFLLQAGSAASARPTCRAWARLPSAASSGPGTCCPAQTTGWLSWLTSQGPGAATPGGGKTPATSEQL